MAKAGIHESARRYPLRMVLDILDYEIEMIEAANGGQPTRTVKTLDDLKTLQRHLNL